MLGPFAIRREDALSWHDAGQRLAGLAERSGFRVRPLHGRWQVWATDDDYAALRQQPSPPPGVSVWPPAGNR